jgi:hypothetical protein
LQAGEGKHSVEIELPRKDYKKLLSNASKNKGFRFTPNVVVGHGFFGNVAKRFLKAAAPSYLLDSEENKGPKTWQLWLFSYKVV